MALSPVYRVVALAIQAMGIKLLYLLDQVTLKYLHHVAHRLVITSVLGETTILALLNVLLLLLKEEIVLHSLLLHLEPPHKILMAMEYLTQVISVLITLTQDASKKEIQQHNNSNLLLMGLGIRQDREIEK